jgi:hypothetical protein
MWGAFGRINRNHVGRAIRSRQYAINRWIRMLFQEMEDESCFS